MESVGGQKKDVAEEEPTVHDADTFVLKSMDRASRRQMKIFAHVSNTQFTIRVGHGNQTVKWLATAAAQRFSRSMVNNGRIRQRETEGSLGEYVPSEIFFPKCGEHDDGNDGGTDIRQQTKIMSTPIQRAAFSPNDLIRDCFQDGDHVYITLTEPGEQITRQNGAEVTSFQRAAFHTHPKHSRRVRNFIKRVKVRRKQKKLSDSITAQAVSDLFDERHTQNTRELRKRCLQEFNRSKIRQLVNNTGTGEEPRLTFEVLAKYFHQLEEIFMFFSTLDDGPINSMSSAEFQEFTKHCGMLDRDTQRGGNEDEDLLAERGDGETPSSLTVQALGTIFTACNIEKDAEGRVVHNPDNPSRELLRFEFLEALVRLAMAKYETDQVIKDAPVCEKVERLCTEYISDYANEICERSLYLRERLSSPAVLEVFHEHLRMLKRVFKTYCKRDSGPAAGDKATAMAAAALDSRRGSTRKMGGIVLSKNKSFHADGELVYCKIFKQFRCGCYNLCWHLLLCSRTGL